MEDNRLFGRNVALWAVILVVLFGLFNLFQRPEGVGAPRDVPYSTFLIEVEKGQVSEVTIQDRKITGTYKNSKEPFTTNTPDDPELVSRLIKYGVGVQAKPSDEGMPTLFAVLLNWFPMLLLIGVWIFFMRQMQSGGGKAMGFGKSRARMLTEMSGRVTFEDVAGIDEAKMELEEIVDFLKDPHKFQRLGGRIPKGVLLVGPPGTGKTLLARAIAGEANVPFFSISGSEFVEMLCGVGASRVRDMFEQAKKTAPCLVFIDEIDAVGRHRGAGLGGGNDEREQTLNQLLVEMDGFEANEGVILIAATNRPDVLDPALLRPGRFDRQVIVPNPDILGRERILKVNLRKVPLTPDVDAKVIARGTPGFSGADLANIVNEAALLAARRNRRAVSLTELEDAKDKVMMGTERRSMVMTEDEKKLTAYHEAGHALVMIRVPGHEPVHKVTIIPRGRALGLTMFLPERDKYSQSVTELKAMIASLFGGRVAEEIIFGEDMITTGASDDIRKATEMARRMVTEFGFSEALGPLRYSANEEEVFLGHSVTQRQNISDETASIIDKEVRIFVEEGEAVARKILTEGTDDLHKLAEALLEYETLDAKDITAALLGEPIIRGDDDDPAPTTGTRSSVPTTGGVGPEPEPQNS